MADSSGGCTKKEATILGLALDIRGVLVDFQARLDNRFDRSGVKCGEDKAEQAVANVLDEIIGELEASKAHLNRIMSFVSSSVLPKIN